ncbi:SHOCT domain-containing protein [Nonomuraea pusilla]|uniref:Phospholipase_D-nuclease N-terminal n=1 Tax=Nonomuraea pusilla TaxID=46177 RepID=A0A1H7IM45_9ACTN|nr:SHOCT domain-containing protein [Nonomuraea pusilla]SEK63569.1 Phospholipase_D-nuclease N-terminal [Nonomuraea pusilla]
MNVLAQANEYPILSVFLTMLWFFLWVMWLMLLFWVFADIFRDDTLGGWAKAGWSVFVIILPFLGVFVYLVARGRGMGERQAALAQRKEEAFRAYVQQAAAEGRTGGGAAGPGAGADELTKLASLRDHGDLTEEEYQRAKAKVLAA